MLIPLNERLGGGDMLSCPRPTPEGEDRLGYIPPDVCGWKAFAVVFQSGLTYAVCEDCGYFTLISENPSHA